ncbi:hypothetical protein AX767_00410 [Variovorax sp. PAMC 28711]|nr:hypothetical protein AX767_00410 [Variovorax sp. PAMC 28711]
MKKKKKKKGGGFGGVPAGVPRGVITRGFLALRSTAFTPVFSPHRAELFAFDSVLPADLCPGFADLFIAHHAARVDRSVLCN